MSAQKIKPCPKCGADDLAVIRYDSGWRYVECDHCWYFGPGEGSMKEAIKSHNAGAPKASPHPSPGGRNG